MVESYRRGPGSYTHKYTLHLHPKASSTPVDQYQNRHAHLVAKPRSNFGCVQHRDLVKFMVAAGHISADHNLPPPENATRSESTASDDFPVRHRLKTPLGSNSKPEKPENLNLSREEMWRVLKKGPSMMRTPTSNSSMRGTGRHAERHRTASPVAKELIQLAEDSSSANLPES